MSLIDFKSVADAQAAAWKSTIVGEVGPARIKVLRMDAQPYEAEVHDYNEGLLVLDGTLMLEVEVEVEVEAETVVVGAGQMYLARAGIRHAVLPGSHGTLAIIDV
ncbi:cupin [Burkholderia arboris]|uniref:cupin n=1 Tax=Burkholderia arboris TaxID=488730 RepID=UPI0030F06BFC